MVECELIRIRMEVSVEEISKYKELELIDIVMYTESKLDELYNYCENCMENKIYLDAIKCNFIIAVPTYDIVKEKFVMGFSVFSLCKDEVPNEFSIETDDNGFMNLVA